MFAELLGDGAHLVGHSYGAVIALLAAAERPEAVRSLTVSEPGSLRVAEGIPVVDEMIANGERLFSHASEIPSEDFLRLFRGGAGSAYETPDELPEELLHGVELLKRERPSWEAEIPLERLAAAGFPVLVDLRRPLTGLRGGLRCAGGLPIRRARGDPRPGAHGPLHRCGLQRAPRGLPHRRRASLTRFSPLGNSVIYADATPPRSRGLRSPALRGRTAALQPKATQPGSSLRRPRAMSCRSQSRLPRTSARTTRSSSSARWARSSPRSGHHLDPRAADPFLRGGARRDPALTMMQAYSGGAASGYSILMMMAMIWFGVQTTDREMATGMGVLAACAYLPMLIFGPPAYPVNWGHATLLVMVGVHAWPCAAGPDPRNPDPQRAPTQGCDRRRPDRPAQPPRLAAGRRARARPRG